MAKNPYTKKRKPKDMSDDAWAKRCREQYFWGTSALRIMRSNWRYRSDCPRLAPDPKLIEFLWYLRKQLRKYQDGRVVPWRTLFHAID